MFLSIRLAAVSAVVSLLFLSVTEAAPTLPVIVVTPSGFEQPREQANSAVTVISRETIEQSNAGSLAELLRGHAGLNIRDLFGDGREAVVDLRGFGPAASSNTLILVDGRRLNNSSDLGAPDLSTIDLDNIERVEVLQGSAGVLYGNQAVGGVVNIIRKKVQRDQTRLALRAGSYNSLSARAELDRLIGRTQLSLSVSDRQSDNYRENNDSENSHLRLRAERQHDSFSAFVELEKTDDRLQTPGALLANELAFSRTQSLPFYGQDFFSTDTDLLRLGFNRHLNDEQRLEVDISTRETEREFIQTFRPFPGALTTQDREVRMLSANWRLQAADDRPLASLVIGFDDEKTDYELLSVLGPQSMDQTIRDIYLSSQWRLSQTGQLDFGLRYSDHEADIGAQSFDDSVSVAGLGYTWSRGGLRLYARADQNFRYPTVEEHTNTPFGQPPGLKTQQGLSLEMGVEYSRRDSRIRASAYNIRLDNEIGFDSTGFSNLNIDETERDGFLFEASRQWNEQLNTMLSLTLIDASITAGPFQGKQLPLVPEQSLRLDLQWSHSENLVTGLEWLHVDKQVFGGDFANQLGWLPSWQVFNAHLSWTLKQWKLSLRINNLANEKYSETGSQFTEFDPLTFAPTNHEAFFPSPERNYSLAVEYRF